MTFLIYLDVCCLNRPFDDQQQERVRLESEAVLLILARCQQQDWHLLSSEAILAEINQTLDLERQTQLRTLNNLAIAQINLEETVEVRAADFVAEGFTVFDALHLACAEAGQATVLLTTDDRFLRRAVRLADMLKVSVANPVQSSTGRFPAALRRKQLACNPNLEFESKSASIPRPLAAGSVDWLLEVTTDAKE